jgi:RNA polymerase sigma-70 factor (sigma-E family)
VGEALPQRRAWEDDPAEPTLGFTSFVAFYEECFAPMVRLAFLLTGSESMAEDLVHDAFARVYARWSRVEHPKAYLRRAVINACHSAARRARRERDARPRPAPQYVVLNADEMFDALGALPYRQRAALVLKYYEGRSQAEIAGLLGCRQGTVASLLHRGTQQLRRVIER